MPVVPSEADTVAPSNVMALELVNENPDAGAVVVSVPESVPVLPYVELSASEVPDVSSSFQYPTRPDAVPMVTSLNTAPPNVWVTGPVELRTIVPPLVYAPAVLLNAPPMVRVPVEGLNVPPAIARSPAMVTEFVPETVVVPPLMEIEAME